MTVICADHLDFYAGLALSIFPINGIFAQRLMTIKKKKRSFILGNLIVGNALQKLSNDIAFEFHALKRSINTPSISIKMMENRTADRWHVRFELPNITDHFSSEQQNVHTHTMWIQVDKSKRIKVAQRIT